MGYNTSRLVGNTPVMGSGNTHTGQSDFGAAFIALQGKVLPGKFIGTFRTQSHHRLADPVCRNVNRRVQLADRIDA